MHYPAAVAGKLIPREVEMVKRGKKDFSGKPPVPEDDRKDKGTPAAGEPPYIDLPPGPSLPPRG